MGSVAEMLFIISSTHDEPRCDQTEHVYTYVSGKKIIDHRGPIMYIKYFIISYMQLFSYIRDRYDINSHLTCNYKIQYNRSTNIILLPTA